jgi:hypothetical protein
MDAINAQLKTSVRDSDRAKFQDHAEETQRHNRSTPVLLTVPCKVIDSLPSATWLSKVVAFRARFEVRARPSI